MHALQILIQADAAYKPSRSHWLQLQNSFNDALLRAFIKFLKQRSLPGGELKLEDFSYADNSGDGSSGIASVATIDNCAASDAFVDPA